MAADLQAIAIEQRWCRSCPTGNLPTASPIPWLGGPVRSARGGWCELGRKTCGSGNLHPTIATGRQCPDTTADLRRSRRRFGLRDGEVSLSGEAAGRGDRLVAGPQVEDTRDTRDCCPCGPGWLARPLS
jgi:hypothetical protein